MNGYVYLWRDVKTDKLYVGARKGNYRNDTYICSSRPMKKEYQQRPQDFVREILFEGPLHEVERVEWDYQIKLFENAIACYNIKPTRYNGGNREIFTKADPEFDLFSITESKWNIFKRKQ